MSAHSDVELFSAENSPVSSQELVEGGEIDLEAKAAKDEALYPDEHSSDEESFDPKRPHDLTTANAKAEAEENGEDLEAESEQETTTEDDRDATDDSIVNDEIELDCTDHKFCVEQAKLVEALLLTSCEGKSAPKERFAALVEVICDHFAPK